MTYPLALPASVRRPVHRATALDVLAFACGVLVLVIFSQAWVTLVQGDGEAPASNPLSRGMFFPAYAAVLALLAFSPLEVARVLLRQPLLILLTGIAAASVLWSVDPGETVRRVIALVFTTMGGVVLAARFRWAALAEVLGAAFALLIAGSFVAALLFPSFGVMHELFPGAWRGLWSEKNALGDNMTMGFMLLAGAAILNPRRSRLWWGLAAAALVLVALSTSKTSLVACLVGVCGLVLVALVRRGPVTRILALYGALIGLLLVVGVLLVGTDVVLAALGKDATLTGRTKIWAAVLRLIPSHPWLGFGYAAVWSNTSPWAPLAWIVKQAGFRPGHAHNSWLEQWLGIGLVGLVAFALYFLSTWVRALIALFRDRAAWLVVPFLLVYSLTTLTESIAVVYNDMRWTIFVALAAKLAFPGPPRPSAAAPIRRQPSATLTTSQPAPSARSIRRPSAPGEQPQGEGVWPTSWV